MRCGLCPESWWLPYGDPVRGAHPYAGIVIDLAAEHWRGHVRRGEDPRIQGREIKARTGDAR
jgi:hypothetical protein